MRLAPGAGLSWWNYLEMIRKCALVGRGVSLGAGFKASKAHTVLPNPHLILVDPDVSPQLLLYATSAPRHDGPEL